MPVQQSSIAPRSAVMCGFISGLSAHLHEPQLHAGGSPCLPSRPPLPNLPPYPGQVVCGSTSGVLDIWSWGYWNDCSDRFPGEQPVGWCDS